MPKSDRLLDRSFDRPPERSFDLSYRQTLWLTEAVRQLEGDAWLDDRSQMLQLAAERADPTAPLGSTEALILERTRRLAGSHPMVGELAREIPRIASGSALTVLGLAAAVLIGGAATAGAVLGQSSVNVVLAWSALLGAHGLTLLLWALSSLFARRGAPLAGGQLWGMIVRRVFAGQRRLVLLRGAATLCARNRLVYWTYSLTSHALWSLFFVSAGLVLTYLFALHEYRFKWETTILPATFFVRFVDLFGTLPTALGFLTPSPDAVAQLLDDEPTRQAWASWLLGSLLVYGLLPRLALATLCLLRLRAQREQLGLDLEQTYYITLGQRLDALCRPPPRVVDPAPATQITPHLNAPVPSAGGRPADDGGGLIFAFELHADTPWPPGSLPPNVLARGNLSTRDEREQLLGELVRHPPRRLLVACEARAGIDRGTLYYFKDVAQHAGAFGALLLNQGQARPGRAAQWKQELTSLGVDPQRLFSDLPDALGWLEARDD